MTTAFVDHYAVLGITPTATSAVVKKAYHQLALQYHPDKTQPGGKGEAAKFISAQAAYEILVDDTKRKAYDVQYGKRSRAALAFRLAHKQARRVARYLQRETDGSYGGHCFGAEEEGGDEEDEGIEDYPDAPSESGSDCENTGSYGDTGIYEDGYADPNYKPYNTFRDVVESSYGVYVGDFDSTDSQYQFPDDFADEFWPAEGCNNQSETDRECDFDEENTTCIADPISEAFGAYDNMRKSHYLEEKILGRYYSKHEPSFIPFPAFPISLSFSLCGASLKELPTTEGALFELQRQKNECGDIDAQLVDIAARVRRRVSKMPTESLKFGEFEEAMVRKLNTAHGAVGQVRGATEEFLQIIRVEHKPEFWRLMNKQSWVITEAIERSAVHLEAMRDALADLDDITVKLEGWTNEDLGEVKAYLGSFMREFRDWQKEITPPP